MSLFCEADIVTFLVFCISFYILYLDTGEKTYIVHAFILSGSEYCSGVFTGLRNKVSSEFNVLTNSRKIDCVTFYQTLDHCIGFLCVKGSSWKSWYGSTRYWMVWGPNTCQSSSWDRKHRDPSGHQGQVSSVFPGSEPRREKLLLASDFLLYIKSGLKTPFFTAVFQLK